MAIFTHACIRFFENKAVNVFVQTKSIFQRKNGFQKFNPELIVDFESSGRYYVLQRKCNGKKKCVKKKKVKCCQRKAVFVLCVGSK